MPGRGGKVQYEMNRHAVVSSRSERRRRWWAAPLEPLWFGDAGVVLLMMRDVRLSAPSASEPFIAVGFMSMAASTFRRTNARFGIQVSRTSAVAARFLIAVPPGSEPPTDTLKEAHEHGDMVWLNMTESSARCALKYLLWMKMAPRLFPSIKFVVLADDDVFVQLGHLTADLRIVDERSSSRERYIYYGLFMWRAYYNRVLMIPNTGFQGWSYTDKRAVALRRTMDECGREMDVLDPGRRFRSHTPFTEQDAKRARKDERLPHCGRLLMPNVRAIGAQEVDSSLAPFPMVNGPCFAVSTALANALVADSYPNEWLTNLTKTPTGQSAPFGYPCWPVGDSIVGLWVTQLALRQALPLELVNMPFFRQHMPWPRWLPVKGGLMFGNDSIVIHGLKGPKHTSILTQAISASSGAFVPFDRECDTCGAMHWSTYSMWNNQSITTMAMRGWTCCGIRSAPGWQITPCGAVAKGRCPKFKYMWPEVKAFCAQKMSTYKGCVRGMVKSGKLRPEDIPSVEDLGPLPLPTPARKKGKG